MAHNLAVPPKTRAVKSEGIYHGLPVFDLERPEHQGLTAIVTGANGISGYHMVKVLAAASSRWNRIYCLSRRPPPDYFFDGLGQGAKRVEHVEANFLAEPKELAEKIKARVEHVYVC